MGSLFKTDRIFVLIKKPTNFKVSSVLALNKINFLKKLTFSYIYQVLAEKSNKNTKGGRILIYTE